MPMSSKFLTESIGEKIVKIDQYLARIWTKYDSLLFLGHPVYRKDISIHICFFVYEEVRLYSHCIALQHKSKP